MPKPKDTNATLREDEPTVGGADAVGVTTPSELSEAGEPSIDAGPLFRPTPAKPHLRSNNTTPVPVSPTAPSPITPAGPGAVAVGAEARSPAEVAISNHANMSLAIAMSGGSPAGLEAAMEALGVTRTQGDEEDHEDEEEADEEGGASATPKPSLSVEAAVAANRGRAALLDLIFMGERLAAEQMALRAAMANDLREAPTQRAERVSDAAAVARRLAERSANRLRFGEGQVAQAGAGPSGGATAEEEDGEQGDDDDEEEEGEAGEGGAGAGAEGAQDEKGKGKKGKPRAARVPEQNREVDSKGKELVDQRVAALLAEGHSKAELERMRDEELAAVRGNAKGNKKLRDQITFFYECVLTQLAKGPAAAAAVAVAVASSTSGASATTPADKKVVSERSRAILGSRTGTRSQGKALASASAGAGTQNAASPSASASAAPASPPAAEAEVAADDDREEGGDESAPSSSSSSSSSGRKPQASRRR